MTNRQVLLCVASSFFAGFAWGVTVCTAAHASDNGFNKQPQGDLPLPPTEGCNPYVVIHPPAFPPDANVMNDVTVELNFDSICGHWKAPQPEVVPTLPLKPA